MDIRMRSRGSAASGRAPVPIRRARSFAVGIAGIAPMTIGNGRSCMFTTGRLAALASISLAAIAMPACAADVTYERLLNAPNEPENWLMVHRDYNNSRHSPLTQINATNAKDLKPKFIFSIGGRATGGTLRGKEESTPLVEDGFMYVADTWTRVTKFDVRSGDAAGPVGGNESKIQTARPQPGHALDGHKES